MSTEQGQRVHELTPEGIRAAKDYLAMVREGRDIPSLYLDMLLSDARYAIVLEPAVYVEKRRFKTRRDAALYLVRRLAPLGTSRIIGNYQLWSWLGMFYFDAIVRKDSTGRPRIGRDPDVAYVIDPGELGRSAASHRNRLMIAYEIYERHRENAWLMLSEPLNSMRDFTHRLSDKAEAFRSRGVIQLAHIMYADRDNGRVKVGAAGGGGNTSPEGGISRLLAVLDQLYMTYDVYGMTTEQILPLLPSEFDRFKPTR